MQQEREEKKQKKKTIKTKINFAASRSILWSFFLSYYYYFVAICSYGFCSHNRLNVSAIWRSTASKWWRKFYKEANKFYHFPSTPTLKMFDIVTLCDIHQAQLMSCHLKISITVLFAWKTKCNSAQHFKQMFPSFNDNYTEHCEH